MAHIAGDLQAFVRAGRRLRAIVGIDLDNTTQEGLEALLTLVPHGHVELFVYHNEAGGVFHPKVYLFTATTHARLIVGSNNLTQAGLFQNTEAGLSIDLPISDPVIKSAQDAMAAWSDVKSKLVLRLDSALLAELVANGYVQAEATTRRLRQHRSAAARKGRKTLFGRSPVTVPRSSAIPKPGKRAHARTTTRVPAGSGTVLLMRVRKARGSQIQLPIPLVDQFFSKLGSVANARTGERHSVNRARARGKLNTYKLEIPETRGMNDPVIRFEKVVSRIDYEVFDAASPKGKTVMSGLLAGLATTPPSTLLTRPATPATSTWWRFI